MSEWMAFPWSLALVMLAYLWWKHKNIRAAFSGTLQSLVGYYLVVLGAQATPLTLGPVSELMQAAFGVDGGVMNSEVFGAVLLGSFGTLGLPVLFLGFLVNVLLARLTRLRGVYLTGHHNLYMALFTVFLLTSCTNLSAPAVLLLGAGMIGIWCWGTVVVTKPLFSRMSGSNVGMANSCAAASLLGAGIGRVFRKKSVKGTEEAPTPKSPSIPVLGAAGTFLVYAVLSLAAGMETAENILHTQSWLLACLVQALLYGAQVALLIHGIQMMISNIIGLFWDVANRLVPELWIGLDASAIISYSPRAWRSGFWSCAVGGLLADAGMILMHRPFVALFSLTSFYFVGGVAGVCANAFGGRRSIRLAGFVTGVVATVLISVSMTNAGPAAAAGAIFGETEYGIYAAIVQLVCKLLA